MCYCSLAKQEAQDDISGWKLIHGDVFRAPRRLGLLTPLLGAGVQIFLSTALTLLFALFGVLNPSYRGGLVHYALFFYAFSGVYAGYHSTRIYKAFHGKNWRSNAFWVCYFLINVYLVKALSTDCHCVAIVFVYRSLRTEHV
jgi:transmembrane 9 superfamily protein 2/4